MQLISLAAWVLPRPVEAVVRTVDGAWNECQGVTAEQGLLARERISSANDVAQTDLDKFFQSWGNETHQSAISVAAAQGEAPQS
ncbi:hypothetical protein [Streptomyces vinaceus]|uniref:hypothetical protein n=1 Tax=Streptomyces vinaceus TaxID=1960 RepID=UPI0037F35B34